MRKIDIRIGTKPSKDDVTASNKWDIIGNVIDIGMAVLILADLFFDFMSKDALRSLFVVFLCLIPGISISYRKEDDDERE